MLLPVRSTVFTGLRVTHMLRIVIEAPLEATTTCPASACGDQPRDAAVRGWQCVSEHDGHTGKNRDTPRAGAIDWACQGNSAGR